MEKNKILKKYITFYNNIFWKLRRIINKINLTTIKRSCLSLKHLEERLKPKK